MQLAEQGQRGQGAELVPRSPCRAWWPCTVPCLGVATTARHPLRSWRCQRWARNCACCLLAWRGGCRLLSEAAGRAGDAPWGCSRCLCVLRPVPSLHPLSIALGHPLPPGSWMRLWGVHGKKHGLGLDTWLQGWEDYRAPKAP